MAHEGFHEDEAKLTRKTLDMHRAIVSLMEELEAIDWYNQRVDAATDEDLKDALRHNADDEKEHAAMLLEWIRRNDPAFERELKDWLWTDKPLRKNERAGGDAGGSSDEQPPRAPQRLTVGSVRQAR